MNNKGIQPSTSQWKAERRAGRWAERTQVAILALGFIGLAAMMLVS